MSRKIDGELKCSLMGKGLANFVKENTDEDGDQNIEFEVYYGNKMAADVLDFSVSDIEMVSDTEGIVTVTVLVNSDREDWDKHLKVSIKDQKRFKCTVEESTVTYSR